MSKSLRWKFVVVMLLLILFLMTVVCVFLIQGVQRFYTEQFFEQMRAEFTDEHTYSDLEKALDDPDPVGQLKDVVSGHAGKLGVDTGTRNFYILNDAGKVLFTTDADKAADANAQIEITPNILKALNGDRVFTGTSNGSYMDVAVPVLDQSGAVAYIVYIRDNKQTVRDLSGELVTRIFEAVAVGFAISVALSFILSKTLLQPIIGMTKAAEAIAEGDFSRKLDVESDDEIGILADTFNNMASQLQMTLEEIKKSEALRREFVANVSHELRTPLTSIRSYAETLTENNDIPKQMEDDFLHVILGESERMTKIVQDLLELSRFDAGNTKLAIEQFSLETSVHDVSQAIALEAQKHGHRIGISLEKDFPEIFGDRARIEQVLLNILSNAVKYTPDGGAIDITGGRTGGRVWVKIKDTGIGIPEEDLSRIFDRFYRVDKARSRESGGTGLGLSIAREIVLRHGGDILIESAVGHGTTVTVVLPVEGPNREQA
ncbi:HAMP domain-containing protein [Sporobacter termitidis DSM 10068]|uniref:histidine kinase n=1 Tax=Sporobacter termitidis DSM 10068 TaxID=1123282 RepID=A0A1M5UNL3_9FIRM|nr:ATP-binding protein [Sporobacter termitidis]SHH64585.1 HAMP domain-containing protein [Sporobacter termitidis DSM 10068]